MKKLINEFKKLNLPKGEYLIYGSGPLGIRGIRKIHDLDIIVKDSFYRKLLKNIKLIPVSSPLIKNFNAAYKRADEVEGFKFVSLKDLILWKRKMAYPKDFNDAKLIKNYLKNQVVKRYNELVRDKILEIIKDDGEIPFWRILNKKDFLEVLKKKLLEKAKGLVKAKKRRGY